MAVTRRLIGLKRAGSRASCLAECSAPHASQHKDGASSGYILELWGGTSVQGCGDQGYSIAAAVRPGAAGVEWPGLGVLLGMIWRRPCSHRRRSQPRTTTASDVGVHTLGAVDGASDGTCGGHGAVCGAACVRDNLSGWQEMLWNILNSTWLAHGRHTRRPRHAPRGAWP